MRILDVIQVRGSSGGIILHVHRSEKRSRTGEVLGRPPAEIGESDTASVVVKNDIGLMRRVYGGLLQLGFECPPSFNHFVVRFALSLILGLFESRFKTIPLPVVELSARRTLGVPVLRSLLDVLELLVTPCSHQRTKGKLGDIFSIFYHGTVPFRVYLLPDYTHGQIVREQA